MPPPGLGQYLILVLPQKPAMLLGDVAPVNLALALRWQESRIGEDNAANGRTHLARNHGGGHAAHGMAEQDRGSQAERVNEADDVACEIAVPIPAGRCARRAMSSRR